MNRLLRRLARHEGFTLAELLIVVTVVGILLAIAVPSYIGFTKKASDTASAANTRSTTVAQAGDKALERRHAVLHGLELHGRRRVDRHLDVDDRIDLHDRHDGHRPGRHDGRPRRRHDPAEPRARARPAPGSAEPRARPVTAVGRHATGLRGTKRSEERRWPSLPGWSALLASSATGARRYLPGFIMWSVERIATEWRTFFARDHWRLRSTHTTCVETTASGAPSDAASAGQRLLPERVLLAVAAEREAELADRVLRAHQHLRLRDRRRRRPRTPRT